MALTWLHLKLQIITWIWLQNIFNAKHNYQFYDVEKHEFLQTVRWFEIKETVRRIVE